MKQWTLSLMALTFCMTGCATFTERHDKAIRDALNHIIIPYADFDNASFASVIPFVNSVIEKNWEPFYLSSRPIVSVLTQYRPIRMGDSVEGIEAEAEAVVAAFRAQYQNEPDRMPSVTIHAKNIPVWEFLEVISYGPGDMDCTVAGDGVVFVRRCNYECQAYRMTPEFMASRADSGSELSSRLSSTPDHDGTTVGSDGRTLARTCSETSTIIVVGTPFYHTCLQFNPDDQRLRLRTANKASDATSEPAPGATSSSHQR